MLADKSIQNHGILVLIKHSCLIWGYFKSVHHQDKIPISELAELSHLSVRTFLRRFKKLTANTPAQYIQRVKVEAAKKMLESTTLQIQQVMFHVGYNDFNAFRKIFKKFAGLSPQAYQKKYNREASFA